MRLEKGQGPSLNSSSGGGGAAAVVSGEPLRSSAPKAPLRISLHRPGTAVEAGTDRSTEKAPLPPVDLLCVATALRDHRRARREALPRIQLTDGAVNAAGRGANEADAGAQGEEAALAFAPDAFIIGADPVSLEQPQRDPREWLTPMRDAGRRLQGSVNRSGGAAPRILWISEDRGAAEALLSAGAADIVVRGEADATLPQIVERAVAARIDADQNWTGQRGVSWLSDGEVRHEREMVSPSTIPSPAWDLVDLADYSEGSARGPMPPGSPRRPLISPSLKRRLRLPEWVDRVPMPRLDLRSGSGDRATVFTVRACPPDCPTCHGSFGMHGRERSVTEVLQEIRELVQKHRVREIAIGDHAFDGQPARALSIVEGFAKLRSAPGHGSLRLTFPRGLRGDGLTPALIDALLAAGTRTIPLRVTTASPRLQRLLKENIDLEKVRGALHHIAARGGRGHLMLRLCLPTETVGEVAHTIRWARSSDAVSASFESGRQVDLGPAWTRTEEGEVDDFPSLRRRAVTAFYSSPKRAGRIARTLSNSLSRAVQRAAT